jgi:hypothetical protein
MNRKFILIGLLLVACFAFTVLQAATGEAQQCDPGPACVENCCGQCDPNPACVENCCPADDPNVLSGNVTLDPNIDLGLPAPSGNVTLDPNIDPQPYIKPKKQGKVQVQQHEQNRTVKPKKQGQVQVQQHEQNRTVKPKKQGQVQVQQHEQNRAVIPNLPGQVQVQQHEQNQETAGLQGQWISCGAIRADIAGWLEAVSISPTVDSGLIRQIYTGCGLQGKQCVQYNFSDGGAGQLVNAMHDRIGEIQNYIQCDTTITCGAIGPSIVDKLQSITGILNSLPQQAWTGCGAPDSETGECIRSNLLDGMSGATDMMNEMKDRISDIQNYIDDRC